MKNLSIKIKLLLIVISTIIVISSIITIQSIYSITQLNEANIQKYKKEAYITKESELKNYVSIAKKSIESYHERTSPEKIKAEVSNYLKEQTNLVFTIIQYQYKKYKGKISDEELKQKIKDIISSTRYGKSGYFWINDTKAVIVDHPIKPHLNGKDLSAFKDKGGKKIFIEFASVASKNSDGFVDYLWAKPNFDKPQPKISYVKLFKPFNWVIGTGAYIDDITSNMQKEALKTVSQMGYGKNGYFWVNDTKQKMIMHPLKPALNGKDLSDSKDPNGIYLFREMTKVCKEKGEGLVKYSWAKPGKDGAQPKFSYVVLFKPWDWIIGTGAYIDDIEDKINDMNENSEKEINNIILKIVISSIVLALIITFIVSMVSNAIIIKPLTRFQEGLISFFKYLNKESNDVIPLDDSSSDEIGNMSKVVNVNIIKTKSLIDQDTKLIKEVEDVIEKVNNGFYMYQVKGKTENQGVESLKNTLNNMIKQTNEKISIIVAALGQYGESHFDYEIPKRDDMNGSLGSLVASTKLIGNNVSEILAMIMNSGDKLNNDTGILSQVSSNLSTSSNEQAASLEETAAALEEITATIQSNTANIGKMTIITNELTNSAKVGMELASKTTTSMEEIDKEVSAIDEAILVIDQIAFQTNILSLNAAVEAATAGEAGKGFAVVAQEVRNLAGRSADAANEIKALVQSATIKANNGKQIAEEMITGYNNLTDKIDSTTKIVSEVQMASKEQENGIIQINDAVTQLDQATQQNASTASQISDLSTEVANLSKDLVTAASRATFNQQAREQVCDIDLVFNTAKIKNGHIVFKTNNFNKLGDNNRWTVVNHHECALGKWMSEQERNNVDFTQTANWSQLKEVHEKVHSGVQSYINEDSQKADNSTLVKISSDIENATVGVFDHLNQLKIEHCKSNIS